LRLDPSTSQAKGNVLRIEATRFEDWGQRKSLCQIHPASLRLVQPAAPWRRSTFNSLAQVIVQCTGAPGELVLTANSAGLPPQELRVRAVPPLF